MFQIQSKLHYFSEEGGVKLINETETDMQAVGKWMQVSISAD